MNGVMSTLSLGSTSLALTALITFVGLRVWRKRPVESYRLAVVVLGAAILLPLGQLVARSSGSALVHPFKVWVDGLRAKETATLDTRSVADAERTAPAFDEKLDPEMVALLLLGQDSPVTFVSEAGTVGAIDHTASLTGEPRIVALLAAVYAVGAVFALARLVGRWLRTRALVRASRPVTDPELLASWNRVAQSSRTARRARLVVSDEIASPACHGWLRPVVMLPSEDVLSFDRDLLTCVLVHEIVHLERRDGFILAGEELLRAVFWFHPAAWWLARELERLRELSCDVLVVRRTGARRRYACALVEYAEWMQFGARRDLVDAHAPALFRSKDLLSRRIEMLLQSETKSSPLSRWLAPAVLGSSLLFLWSGQIALASPSRAASGPACASSPATWSAVDPVAVAPEILDPIEGSDANLCPSAANADTSDSADDETSVEGRQSSLIGITVGRADETLAAQLGASADSLVVVSEVVAGSRAEKAGLQKHDVIVEIQGQAARSGELANAKRALAAGKDIELTVARAGSRRTIVLHAADGGRPGAAGSDALRSDAALGRTVRQNARKYYDTTTPEEFRQVLERAQEAYRQAMKSGAIDESTQRALAKIDSYLKQDMSAALEKARKALDQVNDAKLGERMREALEGLKSKDSKTWKRLGDTQDGRSKLEVQSPRAMSLDDLKREMDATRKLIEEQKRQIELLRAQLERRTGERT